MGTGGKIVDPPILGTARLIEPTDERHSLEFEIFSKESQGGVFRDTY
jgi:hypothetical protein